MVVSGYLTVILLCMGFFERGHVVNLAETSVVKCAHRRMSRDVGVAIVDCDWGVVMTLLILSLRLEIGLGG